MQGSRSIRFLTALLAGLAGALSVQAGPSQMQLPVPRATIYPGQVIDRGMLIERPFRINSPEQAVGAASVQALVGKVARLTLLAGRPITMDAVREPHAVTQGQAATVIFQSGALTITGNAIALQSGGTGEVVSLRNPDSGRIIKGTIGADGAVHVGDP